MRVASCVYAAACLVWAACPPAAVAQPYEAVGMRALGMGGAFVAVADDASAAYWNPAGLASGRFFSFVFDGTRTDSGVDPVGDTGARAGERLTGSLIAVGTPPLAVSYYRLSSVTAQTSSGTDAGEASLSRLRTGHIGVTLVQTLLDGLHVGSTLKYVRADGARADGVDAPDDLLAAASSLRDAGDGAFDLDLGLMADFGRVRAGLAVRNLLEPTFETAAEGGQTLERQIRAGVAVFPNESLSLAADADLTATADLTGERRSLAFGAEQRLWRQRLGVRGGLRFSTAGERRATVTAGASIAIRNGVYADGFVALGVSHLAGSGGGAGLRVIF